MSCCAGANRYWTTPVIKETKSKHRLFPQSFGLHPFWWYKEISGFLYIRGFFNIYFYIKWSLYILLDFVKKYVDVLYIYFWSCSPPETLSTHSHSCRHHPFPACIVNQHGFLEPNILITAEKLTMKTGSNESYSKPWTPSPGTWRGTLDAFLFTGDALVQCS